jgi:hypothetical protein
MCCIAVLHTCALCRAELVETKKAEAKAARATAAVTAAAAAAAATAPRSPTASDSSAALTAPATPATPGAATASSSSGNSSDADDSSSTSSDTDAAAGAIDTADSSDDAIQLTAEEIEAFQSDEHAELDALRLNANVFMPYPACVDAAQAATDEAVVREAAVYLWETVLPSVMRDVKRGAFCPKVLLLLQCEVS